MLLRAKVRKKDGKLHRYFSMVENRRVGVKKRTVQRTVLHLGAINGSQEAAWRKTLEVFNETRQERTALRLFADDEELHTQAELSFTWSSRLIFSRIRLQYRKSAHPFPT